MRTADVRVEHQVPRDAPLYIPDTAPIIWAELRNCQKERCDPRNHNLGTARWLPALRSA